MPFDPLAVHQCCSWVLQKWSSVTVASAFGAWVEHVAEAAEMRRKVQGSLVRLLHRTTYTAFAAWREAAAARAQQRSQVLTCLTRLSQRVSCDIALMMNHSMAPLSKLCSLATVC